MQCKDHEDNWRLVSQCKDCGDDQSQCREHGLMEMTRLVTVQRTWADGDDYTGDSVENVD